MASPITTGASLFSQSSFFTHSLKPQVYSSKTLIQSSHRTHRNTVSTSSCVSDRALRVHHLNCRNREALKRGLSSVCFYETKDSSNGKGSESEWPILQQWDVPWEWYTVSLTSLACGLSFVLTGLIESVALPYLGFQIGELSLDEKAEILFFDQAFATAVVLATLYSITNTSKQNPDDIYRYDWRDPFSLQNGWLLWAIVGLVGALITISLAGVAMSFFSGEPPQRETDALVRLLPLIGSSGASTAYLVGITGVLAPVLEENVFRGFLMVALTKWLPTPISVLISAAIFAAAHLTPGEFPQLFILGTALGLSYAQTRNLLTPITIHALWNSGVILLLTFLQAEDPKDGAHFARGQGANYWMSLANQRATVKATEEIESPLLGFIRPTDFKSGVNSLNSAIIKQNNTLIYLVVKQVQKLEKLSEEVEKVKRNLKELGKREVKPLDLEESIEGLTKRLNSLSITGKTTVERKKGPIYVYKDPKKTFKEEYEKEVQSKKEK
ncbi:hypothetical protein E3N88_40649 [Mikania micrantha]|uniref:CAAX prenyl protease 2/Lysostaphin resistance protein A-like domain-containing protein n=1 Tax=Mikania micrantha TaxID=192012 RepID=A0A5N6LN63_9ASTR|nr:hypothetical protein E3N88_40649 [Mikania micrantha]